jgi:hypothetical protein
MAKPPPDQPLGYDDDEPSVATVEPESSTAEQATKEASAIEPVAQDASDNEVVYRSKLTRKLVFANVVVGVLLCAFVGWFVLGMVFDKGMTGAVIGAALAMLGSRFSREKDELVPIEVLASSERKRAVELRFEAAPSQLIDHRTTQHIDAEATGDSREGYTHWVIIRRESDAVIKLRIPTRKDAIRVSKRLRVLLERPPLQPLGEDELDGEDFLEGAPPSAE